MSYLDKILRDLDEATLKSDRVGTLAHKTAVKHHIHRLSEAHTSIYGSIEDIKRYHHAQKNRTRRIRR